MNANQKYRMLEAGEVPQIGDQAEMFQGWLAIAVEPRDGFTPIPEQMVGKFRRPVSHRPHDLPAEVSDPPAPPKSTRWEYRGMDWKSPVPCHFALCGDDGLWLKTTVKQLTAGLSFCHYIEAVPVKEVPATIQEHLEVCSEMLFMRGHVPESALIQEASAKITLLESTLDGTSKALEIQIKRCEELEKEANEITVSKNTAVNKWVERLTEAENKLSEVTTAKDYHEHHVNLLGEFIGLKGMTSAHIVSETVSLIEKLRKEIQRLQIANLTPPDMSQWACFKHTDPEGKQVWRMMVTGPETTIYTSSETLAGLAETLTSKAKEESETAEMFADHHLYVFVQSIKTALDAAGAPTHHPLVEGAQAAKPMMPQERIAALAARALVPATSVNENASKPQYPDPEWIPEVGENCRVSGANTDSYGKRYFVPVTVIGRSPCGKFGVFQQFGCWPFVESLSNCHFMPFK